MGGHLTQSFNVPIQLKHPNAQWPRYGSPEAAGADLFAVVDTPTGEEVVGAGERKLIKTGVVIELNPGLQAEVRSRSGLALKNGIIVLNSPGTIDSDYRGEIGIILFNTSKEDFIVKTGDRIAQLVLMPHYVAHFELSTEMSATERGEGGFGSTGI